MRYELAKKLKDAGFPQTRMEMVKFSLAEKPIELPYIVGAIATTLGGSEEWRIISPSLSELIEACGEKFGVLERFKHSGKFGAYIPNDIGTSGTGSTPEEAVANLWLDLNK